MSVALISTIPLAVIQAYQADVVSVNIPGLWVASNVTAGWQSDDGVYRLVAYTNFVPPVGKITIGSPSYSVDVNFVVTETYNVTDEPPPSSIISNLVFRSLFTVDELLAIATAALTDGQLRLSVDNFIVNPNVDLAAADTITACNYLVTKGVLTQQRVDEILAFRNP